MLLTSSILGFISAVCTNTFRRLWADIENKKKTCTEAWDQETQLKYNTLFHFLLREEEIIRTGAIESHTKYSTHCVFLLQLTQFFISAGPSGMRLLGNTLFHQAVSTMLPLDKEQILTKSLDLLKASSCLGNHRASLLLATIFLSGLGHSVDQEQVDSVFFMFTLLRGVL